MLPFPSSLSLTIFLEVCHLYLSFSCFSLPSGSPCHDHWSCLICCSSLCQVISEHSLGYRVNSRFPLEFWCLSDSFYLGHHPCFVMYCHVVTVHYLVVLACVTILFTSSDLIGHSDLSTFLAWEAMILFSQSGLVMASILCCSNTSCSPCPGTLTGTTGPTC